MNLLLHSMCLLLFLVPFGSSSCDGDDDCDHERERCVPDCQNPTKSTCLKVLSPFSFCSTRCGAACDDNSTCVIQTTTTYYYGKCCPKLSSCPFQCYGGYSTVNGCPVCKCNSPCAQIGVCPDDQDCAIGFSNGTIIAKCFSKAPTTTTTSTTTTTTTTTPKPTLSSKCYSKSVIDSWISENNLNYYGDPLNTTYPNGYPSNRYYYLFYKYPSLPWCLSSNTTQSSVARPSTTTDPLSNSTHDTTPHSSSINPTTTVMSSSTPSSASVPMTTTTTSASSTAPNTTTAPSISTRQVNSTSTTITTKTTTTTVKTATPTTTSVTTTTTTTLATSTSTKSRKTRTKTSKSKKTTQSGITTDEPSSTELPSVTPSPVTTPTTRSTPPSESSTTSTSMKSSPTSSSSPLPSSSMPSTTSKATASLSGSTTTISTSKTPSVFLSSSTSSTQKNGTCSSNNDCDSSHYCPDCTSDARCLPRHPLGAHCGYIDSCDHLCQTDLICAKEKLSAVGLCCPSLNCDVSRCPFDTKRDSFGCATCACLPDPCVRDSCSSAEICIPYKRPLATGDTRMCASAVLSTTPQAALITDARVSMAAKQAVLQTNVRLQSNYTLAKIHSAQFWQSANLTIFRIEMYLTLPALLFRRAGESLYETTAVLDGQIVLGVTTLVPPASTTTASITPSSSSSSLSMTTSQNAVGSTKSSTSSSGVSSSKSSTTMSTTLSTETTNSVSSNVSSPTTSAPLSTSIPLHEASKKDKSDSRAVIIPLAATLGALLFAALIIIFLVLIVSKKRKLRRLVAAEQFQQKVVRRLSERGRSVDPSSLSSLFDMPFPPRFPPGTTVPKFEVGRPFQDFEESTA